MPDRTRNERHSQQREQHQGQERTRSQHQDRPQDPARARKEGEARDEAHARSRPQDPARARRDGEARDEARARSRDQDPARTRPHSPARAEEHAPASGPARTAAHDRGPARTAAHTRAPATGAPPDTPLRRRVEEVALDLFGRRGFEAVSLKHIADAIGIHKSSIFHYYRTKPALGYAVACQAMGRLRDRMLPLRAEDLTLEQGLQVLDDVVDFLADRPQDGRMALRYLCAPDGSPIKPDRASRASHPGREVYELLVIALERGRARGVIQPVDPGQVVDSLAGLLLVTPSMTGTAEQRLLHRKDPASPEARAARKDYLRRILRSILLPPRPGNGSWEQA